MSLHPNSPKVMWNNSETDGLCVICHDEVIFFLTKPDVLIFFFVCTTIFVERMEVLKYHRIFAGDFSFQYLNTMAKKTIFALTCVRSYECAQRVCHILSKSPPIWTGSFDGFWKSRICNVSLCSGKMWKIYWNVDENQLSAIKFWFMWRSENSERFQSIEKDDSQKPRKYFFFCDLLPTVTTFPEPTVPHHRNWVLFDWHFSLQKYQCFS